jgi:hypothetical protein
MEGKPLHYDGSFHNDSATESESIKKKPFELTDDMRKNITSNPYVIEE